MYAEVINFAINLLYSSTDFESIRKEIIEKYIRTLRRTSRIILCGNSPYAPHAERVLNEKYACNVLIVDSPDDVPFDMPELTYIITSTKYLGDYSTLFSSKGIRRIIPYHALPILDLDFDFSRKSYSGRFFQDYAESILYNKESYKALMSELSDDESREILAHLICYCLTLDYRFAAVPYHQNLYFGHSFLRVGLSEVFIDGGGFDGDTLEAYLETYHKFDSYYLFEPEKEVIEKAKSRFDNKNYNIQFINMALYNTKTNVAYLCDGKGMGQIVDSAGNGEVQTYSIDDINAPISFIKLDVEGSELAVLQGARKTIIKNKPKFAISVYHNAGDILSLSQYLHELVPEYKFYLRCGFNSMFNDLVLFATL